MDIDKIDYLITSVKYDDEGRYIERVRTHEHMDDHGVGYPYPEERDILLKNLRDGGFYATLVASSEDNFDYQVGKRVIVVEIDGEEYIRTDEKKENKDFLENVTRFRDLESFLKD